MLRTPARLNGTLGGGVLSLPLFKIRPYTLGIWVLASAGLVARVFWPGTPTVPTVEHPAPSEIVRPILTTIGFAASALWLTTEAFGDLSRTRTRFNRILATTALAISTLIALGSAAEIAAVAFR